MKINPFIQPLHFNWYTLSHKHNLNDVFYGYSSGEGERKHETQLEDHGNAYSTPEGAGDTSESNPLTLHSDIDETLIQQQTQTRRYINVLNSTIKLT